MRKIAALAALMAGLVACKNPCQDICVEMARFAEDECGFSVPDEQLDTCLSEQKQIDSPQERAACRESGDAETIAAEWGCEELEDYFGG